MEQAVSKAELLSQEQTSLPLFSRELEEAVIKTLSAHRSLGCLPLAGRIWRDHWNHWRVSWDEVKQTVLDLESSKIVGVRAYKGRNRRRGGLTERDEIFLRRG
jgi:hypothetical protein